MVCYKCQITQTLLRGLDEVSQLLHEVGPLHYEASNLLYKVGQQIVAESYHVGVAGWGTRVDLQ